MWSYNVHTWAIFFLRHLANMSCMVPFWASTDSGSVPIWGPRPKPRRPEDIVYILNESCSHFTQRLFTPKVPLHTHGCFLLYTQYIEYHSYLLYYTSHLHIHSQLYLRVSYTTSFLAILLVGWLLTDSCVRYMYCAMYSVINCPNCSPYCLSTSYYFINRLPWRQG